MSKNIIIISTITFHFRKFNTMETGETNNDGTNCDCS